MDARIIPERLREAREAQGFTVATLADELGVTRQAVAQFEIGQTAPSAETLVRLLAALDQPLAFFTTPRSVDRGTPGTTFWRSLKRMSEAERLRIARRLDWARDLVSYVEEFIDLPCLNLPDWRWPDDPLEPREETIERAAGLLRDLWGLGRGPIPNLIGLMEANGIVCVRERVDSDDMDAVSRWHGGRPFVLLAADKRSGPRSLFDAAHELGHLLLHAGAEVDSRTLPKLEGEANYFAGAFLMPRETFPREIVSSSIDHFEQLKKRWRVAIAAMVYRCKNLGILDRNQVEYIWKQMNIRGIRKVEPLDREMSPERPALLSTAVKMLIEHGVQTKQTIRDRLLINPEDIEDLAGLGRGTLDTTVIQFSLHRRTAAHS
jgi:Zn-dependent peptidase ImmA (M78 family)/transcriptional regulator with XRE-family HTH domain